METKQIGMLGAIAAFSVAFFVIGATATPMLIAEPMTMQSTDGWIVGHVETTVFDENGYVKLYRQGDNFVSNNGEDCAIEDLFDEGGTSNCDNALGGSFDRIAIGTSTTAESVSQTTLVAETSRTQDADCTYTAAAGAGNPATCLLTAQFTGSTVTVEESGVFDASAAGNMFSRQLTGTIVLVPADTLQVDWTFTIAGSNDP